MGHWPVSYTLSVHLNMKTICPRLHSEMNNLILNGRISEFLARSGCSQPPWRKNAFTLHNICNKSSSKCRFVNSCCMGGMRHLLCVYYWTLILYFICWTKIKLALNNYDISFLRPWPRIFMFEKILLKTFRTCVFFTMWPPPMVASCLT